MTEQTHRVLLVCADVKRGAGIVELLDGGCSYSINQAANAEQALMLISESKEPFHFVLIDAKGSLIHGKGGKIGISTLISLAGSHPRPPEVILLSDVGGEGGNGHSDISSSVTVCSDTAELLAIMRELVERRGCVKPETSRAALEALLCADSALHEDCQVNDVLRLILQGVLATGFDRARLYVMSSDRTYMNVAAQAGMGENFASTRWLITNSIHILSETSNARLFRCGAKNFTHFEHFLEKEDAQEWACAPLLHKGQLIGVLSADTVGSGRQITDESLLTLTLFATQARLALCNNVIAEIEERIQHLQSILEIYTSLSSTLKVDSILRTACRSALHLIGADQCWLMLFTPDLERGIIRAAYPKGLMVRGSEVSLSDSAIKEHIAKLRTHLIVPDVEDDPRLGSVRDLLMENNVKSCLMVPVISKGRILGTFCVDSVGHTRTFSEQEIKLCQVVAAQLGVAVENARLYAEAERRASELEALRKTTLTVTSAHRLEVLLGTIIEQAKKLLNGKNCGIYRYHRDLGELEIIAESNRPYRVGKKLKVGHGMAGRLVLDDAPFMRVPNYNEWEGKAEIYSGDRSYVSVLEVPLRLKNETIGVLYIDDEAGRHFTNEEARILGLFADQAAIAIEKATLVEQLDEQQRLLDNLISNMPDGLVAVDTRGRITRTNSRANEILGFGPDEPLPDKVSQIYYDPEDARRIKQKLSEAKGRIEYSTFAKAKDGHAIPIRLFVSMLHGVDNEHIGSVGYFEDLRSNFQTKRLLEACGIVAKAETLNKGLQDLADMLVKLLSATFCRILLLDGSGQYLTVKAAYPARRGDKLLHWQDRCGHRLPLSEYTGLKEILYGSRPRVLRIRNPKTRPWLVKYSEWLGLETPVQSLLIIPLRVGETVVGLLNVGELRREERSPFTKDKSDLAAGIAGQVAALIDRSRLQEATDRRNHLLTAMAEKAPRIRGEEEPEALLQEFVRLAADMIGYKAAGIYTYHRHLDTLELNYTYGPPSLLTEACLERLKELAGEVARARASRAVNEYSDFSGRDLLLGDGIRVVVGVPLKLSTGEVEAVFFAVSDKDEPAFVELEIEALERFAELAVNALQTSRSMDLKHRMVGKVKLLHQLSEYAQEKQDIGRTVDVLLTGITASYGLGFNRAAMILLEDGKRLVGFKGVGHLSREDALDAWVLYNKSKERDFKSYTDALDQGHMFPTPIGERIHKFHFTVSALEGDAFSRVVHEKQARVLRPDELDEIPIAFRDIFQPDTEVVLLPLVARRDVIGVIVADNKFTRRPITQGDIESLLTFANTAAIGVDNIKLLRRLQDGQEALKALFQASTTLISSDNPKEILQKIVEQTRRAATAAWARVILIDQSRRAHTLVSAGCDDEVGCDEIVRPDGIAMRVMRTGVAEVIENTHDKRDDLNPIMLKPDPGALLCLPLALQGKNFGVTWISYLRPRQFSKLEIEALQLYVNQAAVAYDSSRRMEVLEHMQGAVESMARASDPSQVLRQIVDRARSVLQAHSAALCPYDSSNNSFVHEGYVASNIPDELMSDFLKNKPRHGGTAYTVMEKGWLRVEDVEDIKEYEFLGGSTRELLLQLGVRSFLGISLVEGGENLGVLYVNYDQPLDLGGPELNTARTFANYAALELKKATLLEQRKVAHEQLRKAQKAASVVAEVTALGRRRDPQHPSGAATMDPLQLVVEGTKEALGCDAVTLYTYDDDRKEFDYPPKMVGVWHENEVIKLGHVTESSVVRAVLKLNGLHEAQDTPNDPLLGKNFAQREGIKSSVAIPLIARGHSVGVLFANFRTTHVFTEGDLTSIDLFAQQAAVAIRNEQLYEQAQKRAERLQVLHEAGRNITSSLDLQETLRRIAKQAWELVNYKSKQASFVDIKELDGTKVRLAAAFPHEEEERIRGTLGEVIDLKKGIGGRKGVIGRAIQEGKAQYVKDVLADPDYVAVHGETKSQIVVLIKRSEKVIGAISVEHPDTDAFDEETFADLESLAAQAGIAIENARQYEELNRTKIKVAAQTSLAWMGMASSTWQHEITGHAITIGYEIDMLRRELPERTRSAQAARLNKIERLTQVIKEKPVTASLSPEGAMPMSVNDWINERLKNLWEDEPYKSISLHLSLAEGTPLPVRIHPEWLRQVFNILLDNSVKAMTGAAPKKLTVTASEESDWAVISIADTGPGIPADILETLFQMQIPRTQHELGLGMGLLMVQTILQAYGGKVWVGQTSSQGTTMIVRLPLAL